MCANSRMGRVAKRVVFAANSLILFAHSYRVVEVFYGGRRQDDIFVAVEV